MNNNIEQEWEKTLGKIVDDECEFEDGKVGAIVTCNFIDKVSDL